MNEDRQRVTRAGVARADFINKRITKKAKTVSKQPRFAASEPQNFYYSTLQWYQNLCELEPSYRQHSRERDRWLSEVWKLEPHLAGILHSVVSIDTNRGWSLEGGRNQVLRFSNILHNWEAAPGIKGWRPGISLASQAYYSTDVGGLVELGRDQENGPLRGLFHLDPTRCELTGSVETPLTYFPMASYGVDTIYAQDWRPQDYLRVASMISISENLAGLGYCAVSRAIQLTKLMVAVLDHDRETLGAKAPRGLLLLNGIAESQWDTAMEAREERAKSATDRAQYFNAVAVLAGAGMDNIDAKLIALSTLPVGFDMQGFVSMLMYGYALCFGYDPSEFYPVQFGALGRGTEMEVQHEKATGKGGLNFIFSLQEQLQRSDVLPPSIKYEFDQRDEQADAEQAATQRAWADLFKTLRETGIDADQQGGISRIEYRMLLADHSIIPNEWTDVLEDVEATDEESVDTLAEDSLLVPEEGVKPGAEPGRSPDMAGGFAGLGSLKALLNGRSRRIMRDNLLSKPHIWEVLQRTPKDDIVQYAWPAHRMVTLWEQANTLLDRITFSSATVDRARTDPLYKTADMEITKGDVDNAIKTSKEIDPDLHALLVADEKR